VAAGPPPYQDALVATSGAVAGTFCAVSWIHDSPTGAAMTVFAYVSLAALLVATATGVASLAGPVGRRSPERVGRVWVTSGAVAAGSAVMVSVVRQGSWAALVVALLGAAGVVAGAQGRGVLPALPSRPRRRRR
jgi:hypothetical protein